MHAVFAFSDIIPAQFQSVAKEDGETPYLFLNSLQKYGNAENPDRVETSVTEYIPVERRSFAWASLKEFIYFTGDVPYFFLNSILKYSGDTEQRRASSLTDGVSDIYV